MTKTHVATCPCGQIRVVCEGDPVRISMCHCLECQKRSGSTYAVQARWPAAQVTITGTATRFSRVGDEGTKATFHFCPICGATVYYRIEAIPDVIAVAVGNFADPDFPAPRISVYGERRHSWVSIPDGAERYD